MDALVQPVMLPLDAKHHPLVQVITVVATASASSLALCDRAAPAWSTWLAGRFTKSVRVAKTRAAFAAALDTAEYVATFGELSAAAFAPVAYAEMPKWMSQARVEGLHCAGELPDRAGCGEWAIGVVAQMSAGKAAAQVAHALCRIVLDIGSVPTFSFYQADANAHGVVEIVDAGLTEFGGVPTRTVVASPL